jgi:hypothetical protein
MIALVARDDAALSINSSQIPDREEVPRLHEARRQVGAWFRLLADCKSRCKDGFLLQNSSLEFE